MTDSCDLIAGDCRQVLGSFPENHFDGCITDPPYGMKMDEWDHRVPETAVWREVLRVLKPGAFCLSFCSPQLYHRLACNVEDAGLLIQDQIMWLTTTKMPGRNRLKPAHEPIVVAQKPLAGSLRENLARWGVGRIDVESTRIPWDKEPPKGWVADGHRRRTFGRAGRTTGSGREFGTVDADPRGRYPSNVLGDGLGEYQKYFYAPRVSRRERGEFNDHPTPKPIDLMAYLVRLFVPAEGRVLDPFCGSGSTGIAALTLGYRFVGIDVSAAYLDIARRRIEPYLA